MKMKLLMYNICLLFFYEQETIWKNFKAIELKPDRFKKYLLTEIGFSKCEYLDVAFNKSKGNFILII